MPPDAELSRHDPDVPDWDSLPPDARRLAARMMEVYAGFLSHTDHHIGRLLDFLKETGEFDNTLIMVVSETGPAPRAAPPEPPTNCSSSTTRRRAWRKASPRSTSWAAPLPSTIIRGGGPGRGTPRSAGGSGKPTGAVPPTRSWCTGRPGSPRAGRYVPSTRTSSTWCLPCWTRSA